MNDTSVNTIKRNTVEYVYFDQLPGADRFLDTQGSFDGFSYGDAAMTLVTPGQLLEEVDSSECPELYKSLMALDPETLVGFDS